jgi:hypothetical protein
MLAVLLCALLTQNPAVAGVVDVAQFTVSAPRTVTEVDTGKIPGSPVRLAWGPDGSFYVRVAETDRWANERSRHFVVMPADKATLAPIDGEPSWAPSYWMWKSATLAPGMPTLKLDIEIRQELATAVGTVRDGGESQNRGDPSRPQGATDVASAQNVRKTTVRLKGETVAETVNATFIPGLTFSWAPSPMGLLAYVDGKKRLMLMDREGRKREIAGAVDVLLPAWSPDGKQIAYLQKNKKKYVLTLIDVGR